MTIHNTIANPDHKNFLKHFWENYKKAQFFTPEILHPGKRPEGVSFNRREQMRRNKAKYGKRQICVHLFQNHIAIQRNYHMRMTNAEIEIFETKPLSYLESYRTSLITSGYVLLEGSPSSLIFQYEGRIH